MPITLQEDGFVEPMLESGNWEVIGHLISGGASENELSPNGVLTTTRIFYDVISKQPTEYMNILVANNLLGSLISLINTPHLERLKEWYYRYVKI